MLLVQGRHLMFLYAQFMNRASTASRIRQGHCRNHSWNTGRLCCGEDQEENKTRRPSVIPPSLHGLNNVMRNNKEKTKHGAASHSNSSGCRVHRGKQHFCGKNSAQPC